MKKRYILLLVLMSIIINLIFMHPDNLIPSDGAVYSQIGRNVAEGRGFTYNNKFDTQWPPLFSIALGGVYALFGFVDTYGIYLNIIVSSLCVIFIILIADYFFNDNKLSALSAVLFILNQQVIGLSAIILSDMLALLFLLAFFYFFIKEKYPLSAVFIGLMALTRRTALAVFIAAVLILWFRKDRIKNIILFVLIVLILVSPYFYKIYLETGNPFSTENQDESLVIGIENSVSLENTFFGKTEFNLSDYILHNIPSFFKKWVMNFFGIFFWIIPNVLGYIPILPFIFGIRYVYFGEGLAERDKQDKLYHFFSSILPFIFAFIILFTFVMANQRYLVVILPFMLIISSWAIIHFFEKTKISYVYLAIIIFIYIMPTIFGFVFYEPEHPEWITAGKWMKDNLPSDSKILSRKPQIPYYAGGMIWTHLPMDLNSSMVYAKENGYGYIIFDEAYTAVYRPEMIDLIEKEEVDGLELVYSDITPLHRVKIWRISDG